MKSLCSKFKHISRNWGSMKRSYNPTILLCKNKDQFWTKSMQSNPKPMPSLNPRKNIWICKSTRTTPIEITNLKSAHLCESKSYLNRSTANRGRVKKMEAVYWAVQSSTPLNRCRNKSWFQSKVKHLLWRTSSLNTQWWWGHLKSSSSNLCRKSSPNCQASTKTQMKKFMPKPKTDFLAKMWATI